jgi:excisionase family DNA binding protein
VIKLVLLTIEQAAAYLQMNPQVVRRWLREKKLPGFKMGQEWRIDEADLAALIEDAKEKNKQ